jgi:hypothetical protein
MRKTDRDRHSEGDLGRVEHTCVLCLCLLPKKKKTGETTPSLPLPCVVLRANNANTAAPRLEPMFEATHHECLEGPVRGVRSLGAPRQGRGEAASAAAAPAGSDPISLLPTSLAGRTVGVGEIHGAVCAVFRPTAGLARRTPIARDDLGRHRG